MKYIIENIKKATGKSQSQLSKELGVPQSRISEYKKEAHQMPVKKLLKWCEILKIDPSGIIQQNRKK